MISVPGSILGRDPFQLFNMNIKASRYRSTFLSMSQMLCMQTKVEMQQAYIITKKKLNVACAT